jgi:intracellular multiplication protein IcmW
MPDLSHEAALQFWSEFPDPNIYRVITFLESVEHWTIDNNENLENLLKTLGHELDNFEDIDLSSLNHEEIFIKILAGLKTSRGLRLLQAIDTAQPGSASRVIMQAEEMNYDFQKPPYFFIRRNMAFERLRLLNRIFASHRLKIITQALEGDDS